MVALNDLEISLMRRGDRCCAPSEWLGHGKVKTSLREDRGGNVNLTTRTDVTIAARTSCELVHPRSIRYTGMNSVQHLTIMMLSTLRRRCRRVTEKVGRTNLSRKNCRSLFK